MQSEQLSNLHLGWVIGGWAVASAITAAMYVAGAGVGLVPPGAGAVVWVAISMAAGFFAAGLLIGLRWTDAPILHGAAITFVSVLVWFAVALQGGPEELDSIPMVLGLILLQLVSSAAGGWTGRRVSLGSGNAE